MQFNQLKRREFITLLGGGAAAWSATARAQQAERMHRIGVLMNLAADDAEGQARLAAFLQALRQLGWTEGRNARIDVRWSGANAGLIRKYAAELVALAPDVILAPITTIVQAVREASRTVPIVFASAVDPVGSGLVESLAHPGGNVTGFSLGEFDWAAKSLELLKDIAPDLTRVAVLRDSAITSGPALFAAIQTAAPSFRVQLTPIDLQEAGQIEHSIAAFARQPNGGLIATFASRALVHRDLIIKLAARHRLPAIYPYSLFVRSGGLISYSPDIIDQHRRAAEYVDRILRGKKPADLPVQAPTRYELTLNLKTAKVLGLEVPPGLSARADEV